MSKRCSMYKCNDLAVKGDTVCLYHLKQIHKTKKKSGNKYNAVKQTYNGYSYDSKLEAAYAKKLDDLIKIGVVEKVEKQHRIGLYHNETFIADYFIDFKVWFTDGRVEYHEVKGFETKVWRLKWKMAKAQYPHNKFVKITEVR